MPQAALSPTTDSRDRPDDCACTEIRNTREQTAVMAEFDIESSDNVDVPCWPCAREGFETRKEGYDGDA